MALFLNKTGRPIALSCEYALYQRGSLIKVRKTSLGPAFTTNLNKWIFALFISTVLNDMI